MLRVLRNSRIPIFLHRKSSHNFKGYLTIHGEGETDGITKIKFCSSDKGERRNYINECTNLYSLISHCINTHKISRLLLHPDSLSKKITRKQQVELLAKSLSEIADQVDTIESICVEPRGGDRQGKVLRAEIQDIKILEERLNSHGVKKIGLCIDVGQLFVVHGNDGIVRFLQELKTIRIPVKEFHISDVRQTKKVRNRVAMEVGTGAIDWRLILPSVLQHCNELLIETLGGIKVFQKSKSFLESLVG